MFPLHHLSRVSVPSWFSTPSYSSIASINPRLILESIENRVKRPLVIRDLTTLVDRNADESNSKFQQVCGAFLIFQAPIFNEINQESQKFADEGYGNQGSRMAFHRPSSIIKDFKKALQDPARNRFLLVMDERTGEIFGSISLLQSENGLPELSNFYLSQEVRKEFNSDEVGLAKYLFSRMLSFAKEIDSKEVFLTSRRKGGFEKALHLFTQFGFSEVTKVDEVNRLVRPEYRSPRTIAMLLNL